MYLRSKKKGLSPVISQIILAATVLTVGTGIWYFSMSYCSVTTDSYIDETLERMNVAIERFSIERVSTINPNNLTIWINNYGEVDITIDIYADSENKTSSIFNIGIPADKFKKIELDFSTDPLESGDNFQIKVASRRQNFAYMFFTVS